MKKLGDYSKIPVLGTRGKILLSAGLVALGLLVLVLSLKACLAQVASKVAAVEVEPAGSPWGLIVTILLIGVVVASFFLRGRLVADFIARSWPGWVVLGLSLVWNITGGGHLGTWKYFNQVTAVLAVGATLGALFSLWAMSRAADEYDYGDVGTGAFTGFAVLLALWIAFVGSPPVG